MDLLKALQSKSSSCTDISTEDNPTGSTEYHTLTDNEEEMTTTNCDNLSVDLSMDLNSEEQPASLSDYQTLSPDVVSNSLPADADKPARGGKPEYECKICVRQYPTLQECLRHELLEHAGGQKSSKKSVRTSLSHLLPTLENNNQKADRARIHELFKKCKPGLELQELFKIYCISNEKVKQIVAAVNTCLLKDLWPSQNVKVYTFGSCENGLMMWDSDIDIYVSMICPTERFRKPPNDGKERQIYNRINAHLRRSPHFDEIVAIRHARVPIVKCRHLATGMRIDINCSCPNSVVNTAFLRELNLFDCRIHSFMRFVKVWAKQMWIVGRNRMTSYCLCILALFYLQQPRNFAPPFVPAIQRLQHNVPPKYVQGVNYAFDLYRHMRPIPVETSTSTLIRGFFKFYRNFDFHKQMILPFPGISVPLEDFRSGKYRFPAYHNQLKCMQTAANRNDDIEELSVDRVMVVQDPFQLNQNVARGVTITQLEYFRKCVEYGFHISMDAGVRTDGQFYEALLFDIIGNMGNEVREQRICTGPNTALVQPHEMLYKFTPCRAEIRAITAQQLNASVSNGIQVGGNADSIYRIWTRHYIEAIYAILTHIYCLDVKLLNDNDDPYDERLLNCNRIDLNESTYIREQIVESLRQLNEKNQVHWIINGSIDTWSERTFQRDSTQTFMSFQYAQTRKFLEERHGKTAYAVKFLGRFSLRPLEDCKTLEIVLRQHQQTRQWFCKKEPMRKFFTNFKCSLQNFNLKEKLQTESGRKYGIPPSISDENLFWQLVGGETLTSDHLVAC